MSEKEHIDLNEFFKKSLESIPKDEEPPAIKPSGHIPQILFDKAFDMYAMDYSFSEVAKELGLSSSTISSWCKKYGWERRRDKMRQIINEEYDEYKSEQIAEERKKADGMHRKALRYMMGKILYEEQNAVLNTKEDEQRLLTRMKVHKSAVESLDILIKREREILGIESDKKERGIPSEYKFIIHGLDDNITSSEDLRSRLKNQDPFHYPVQRLQAPQQFTEEAPEEIDSVSAKQVSKQNKQPQQSNGRPQKVNIHGRQEQKNNNNNVEYRPPYL